MKPAKGDIWKLNCGFEMQHHLILDDGCPRRWDSTAIDYETLLLETGESDVLYYRPSLEIAKVA